jgi:hypothetical protein
LIEYTVITANGTSLTVHSGDRDVISEGTAVELVMDPTRIVLLNR